MHDQNQDSAHDPTQTYSGQKRRTLETTLRATARRVPRSGRARSSSRRAGSRGPFASRASATSSRSERPAERRRKSTSGGEARRGATRAHGVRAHPLPVPPQRRGRRRRAGEWGLRALSFAADPYGEHSRETRFRVERMYTRSPGPEARSSTKKKTPSKGWFTARRGTNDAKAPRRSFVPQDPSRSASSVLMSLLLGEAVRPPPRALPDEREALDSST